MKIAGYLFECLWGTISLDPSCWPDHTPRRVFLGVIQALLFACVAILHYPLGIFKMILITVCFILAFYLSITVVELFVKWTFYILRKKIKFPRISTDSIRKPVERTFDFEMIIARRIDNRIRKRIKKKNKKFDRKA